MKHWFELIGAIDWRVNSPLPRRNASARRAATERVRTPRLKGVNQSLNDRIKEQIGEVRVRGGAKGEIDRKVEVARGRGRCRGWRGGGIAGYGFESPFVGQVVKHGTV